MSDSESDDFRDILESNRVQVVQSLDLDRQFMLSYLRSNSVLDDEDCQLILNAGASRQQKNSRFLDVISTRGKKAYQNFVNALEFEHSYLYELFTGKKPSDTIPETRVYNETTKRWVDYDRDYLAKELAKVSEQYTTLAYMQGKLQREKQEVEKKLLQTISELNKSRKGEEELRFELSLKQEIQGQARENEISFIDLIKHSQNLAQENAEKSNVIIALQARLLAVNEDRDEMKHNHEELQSKNKTLKQQVKDMTINYDFQRTKSKHLQEKYDQSNNELSKNREQQRELHAMKFNFAKVNEEKEELSKKLDEYRSVMTSINAKLSLVKEQKAAESERRSEISEEYLKIRQQAKMYELERDQSRNMCDYLKEKVERLESQVSSSQEQNAFLSKEVENAITERNRTTKEREEIMKYNNELLKSRDEAVQNQMDMSRKFDARYKEATSQLDEAKQELKALMLEHIRTNSTQDGQQKCQIFENELEMARKDLSSVLITSEIENKNHNENGLEPASDKSDVARTTSVLDQAIDNLNGNRLRSLDFSLSNRQLSWVYDSLKGYDTSFSAVLGNPFIFPQFQEEKTNSSGDEKSGDKRRLGSNRRGMIDKARSKSAAYPSYDAVKQICPVPLTPEIARRSSATTLTTSR